MFARRALTLYKQTGKEREVRNNRGEVCCGHQQTCSRGWMGIHPMNGATPNDWAAKAPKYENPLYGNSQNETTVNRRTVGMTDGYDSSFVQWKRVTAADAAAAAGLRGEVPSNDQAEDSAGLGYPHPIVNYRGIWTGSSSEQELRIQRVVSHDSRYLFLLCPQWVYNTTLVPLPDKKYFIYQLEQLDKSESPHIFNPFVFHLMLHAKHIFDYSNVNLTYYGNKIQIPINKTSKLIPPIVSIPYDNISDTTFVVRPSFICTFSDLVLLKSVCIRISSEYLLQARAGIERIVE